jgi:hypothetical protein
LKIKNIKDLGPQFVNNKHKMVGQDGAYSIPLNGKCLWFFGDTLIGRRIPGESLWYPGGEKIGPESMAGVGGIQQMLTNTGLVVYNNNAENGITDFQYICNSDGTLKQIIPLKEGENPDEFRVWCLHGIKLNDRLYLFYQKIQMLGEGDVLPVNFKISGSGLASGSETDWEFKRLEFNDSDLIWKERDPQFSAAVYFSHVHDYIYLYGVIANSDGVQQCYIARIRPAEIANFSAYEYQSEQNIWSKNIGDAKPIFNGMPNELSVSYNNYLRKYLAVHSLDLTGKIVGRTASNPWGPWSESFLIKQIEVDRPIDLNYPVLIYAGKEHPFLSKKNGKIIYITYIEFEEYFPHLLEVEFE